MTKLISHQTTETLPSGTTITTLHLTPEAKRGLSTNGATIPPQPGEPSAELTVYDPQQRLSKAQIAFHAGTFIALIFSLLGVQPVVGARILSIAVSILTMLWARRARQAIKRSRLMAPLGISEAYDFLPLEGEEMCARCQDCDRFFFDRRTT